MRAIDQYSIRQQNMEKVWTVLQQGEPISRQTLAERTGLSLMTVSNVVDQLNRQGVLRAEAAARAASTGHRQAGRKAELLSIDESRHAWLILDITSLHFRRSTLALNLVPADKDSTYAYTPSLPYTDNLRRFLSQTREYINTGLKDRTLTGIAVITPGPYSVQGDTVYNRRIPALGDVSIKALLRQALGDWPYFVEEDVKLAVRAYLPSARQADADLLYYLYIGEGVGGAVAYHGDVLRGLNAVCGDMGQVIAPGGVPFESVVSLCAFARQLALPEVEALSEDALLLQLTTLAKSTPAAYRRALLDMAALVAQMLYTALWMLDPDQIVIDCRYAAPFEADFLEAVRSGIAAELRESLPRTPDILPARYEMRGTLYGAAQALSRAWFERIV